MCKQYISDIITTDDIDTWSSNKIVFIESPTGSGKSHFIKNNLSDYKPKSKILLLVNRTLIKNQSNKELDRYEINNVTVATYQYLTQKILKYDVSEFLDCDYIICDESHFFCEESEFIYTTDIPFDWVIRQNAIKIFMTATAFIIKRYIQEKLKLEIIHYQIENKYEDYIEKLYFYEDDDTIKKLLLELPSDEKAIYFTNAERAHEMGEILKLNSLKACVFYCSKNNRNYKYVDKEAVEYLEEYEMFEQQIMCTTKVMDCGVNIHDKMLKHIIVDMADISSLIQCIGRKRIDKNEKIILYIKDKKGNAIARKLESIKDKLFYANIMIEKGDVALIQEYSHKNSYGNLIYDITFGTKEIQIQKKINDLMYFTYTINEVIYEQIIKNKKDGFKCELLERMKLDMEYKYLEEELDALTLQDILDKLVGVKMFKEEQNKFKERLLKELLNAPKGSHGSVGLKTINALFEENEFNYRITSDKENSRKSKDYKKTFWMIIKTIEN